MEWLKFIVVAIIILVIMGIFIGTYILRKGHPRDELPIERKIRTILELHASTIEASNYREEIQLTMSSNYHFFLNLINDQFHGELFEPLATYDLNNSESTLTGIIIPYLQRQNYHDLEPLDRTLRRLIIYYNNECPDTYTLAELCYMVLHNTPPIIHGYDPELMRY